jgi:predicted AAA+ superfamily ATPase
MGKKKALIIIGARQVGKTTIVKQIASTFKGNYLFWNCDEPDVRSRLDNPTSTQLKQIIGNNKLVILDEAQRINNIGITIKLIVDNITDVQVIVTGSSSFELAKGIYEPLTGRKFEFKLYPFSLGELVAHTSLIEQRRLLEHRILYGFYPDVVNNPGDERSRLNEIISSYLFKDIFSFGNIRKPDIFDRLIKALALQIGNEVSFNELSKLVGINKETVYKYIDLLEKTFIVFVLNSFSRNQRNELKKSRKIYFWDTGIRNAIIDNFNSRELRNDWGFLWENFITSERMKYIGNTGKYRNYYFWRTAQKQEIDLIEEYDGQLHPYEFKWNPKVSVKLPKSFFTAYGDCEFNVINSENFMKFVL